MVCLNDCPDRGHFVGELPGKLTFQSRLDEVERIFGSGSRDTTGFVTRYEGPGIVCRFENQDLTGRLISVGLTRPKDLKLSRQLGYAHDTILLSRQGHDWSQTTDTCLCMRCGKTRKEGHDWSKDCEKCSQCGRTRSNGHAWNKCVCTGCGHTRHDWSKDCDHCAHCGIKIGSGSAHSWHPDSIRGFALEGDTETCSYCHQKRKISTCSPSEYYAHDHK